MATTPQEGLRSAEIAEIKPVDTDRSDEMEELLQDLDGDLQEYRAELADLEARMTFGSAAVLAPQAEELEEQIAETERLREKVETRMERGGDGMRLYRLEPDEAVDFEAGQFITIQHDEPGRDRPLQRSYSLANPPEEDGLELCVRLVEDGAFTPQLWEMEEGDTLDFKGPNGHFTLEDVDRDQVFIATGTGIGPIKGMVDHLYEQALVGDEDVWVFYGTRWEDDLCYRDEFEALDRLYDSFHFVPTLSAEPEWDGETEYVQRVVQDYVEEGTLDPDDMEAYICGLKPMVKAAKETLEDVAVNDDHINFELYA